MKMFLPIVVSGLAIATGQGVQDAGPKVAVLKFTVKDAGASNPPLGGATVTVTQGTKPPIVFDPTNAAGEAQFPNLEVGPVRIKASRPTYVDLEQTETLTQGNNDKDGYMSKKSGSRDYFIKVGETYAWVGEVHLKSSPASEPGAVFMKQWHSLSILDANEKAWVAEGMAKKDAARMYLMNDASFATALKNKGH